MAENNEKGHYCWMKHLRSIFVCLVLLLVHTESVSAQGGLSVVPVFHAISFSSEVEKVDFPVTLTNTTSESLTLRPSVVDFGSLDDSGGVAFLGSTDGLEQKYGLASWMRLEKDVIFLDAGESAKLRVTIENRESLSPGGHYGAVLFQIGTDGLLDSESAVSVNQAVSMLVFAKKEGGERYDLVLKEAEFSHNPFLVPSRIHLRFQNGGNVHVTPRGRVVVADPFGRIVKKGSINPESGLILPETQRVYTTQLQVVAPVLFPGFYDVVISTRYDGNDNSTSQKTTIFLFPWYSIGVFLMGGALYGMRRWYKRKQLFRKEKKEKNIT